jgi:hypothetical protein
MQLVYSGDRFRDLPTGFTFGPCAEQRVDYHLDATRVTGRGSSFDGLHCIDGAHFFGNGIGTFRLDCLDDRHFDSRSRQETRDDPTVSAIIPRPCENNGAISQTLAISAQDLLGRGRAGTLHQRARRNSFLNGRPIALR